MRSERGNPGALNDADDPAGYPRVCFVSSHAQLGGSEVVFETLLEELPDPLVRGVVLLQEGPLLGRLQHLEPIVIPTGPRALDLLGSARKLRAHLKRIGPELVHANGVKAALVAVLARPGVPILWMKHDFSFDGRIGRWLSRKVTRVVGVSAAVLAEVAPKAKTAVVHPATTPIEVDSATARRELIDRLGLRTDAKLVGLLGRLHPSKGHEELVAILPSLPPETHLVFAGGEDPSAPETKERVTAAAIDAGCSGSVSFIGHVDDPERVIAGLDVLAIPSIRAGRFGREGFGLTAVEAMLCGTPVVAYDSGALQEVVGDCGVVVPEGDRDGLRQAIEQVMTDADLRTQLARCGVERARTLFSLAPMLEAMEQQYRECLREA